jgi:hypothetical protein
VGRFSRTNNLFNNGFTEKITKLLGSSLPRLIIPYPIRLSQFRSNHIQILGERSSSIIFYSSHLVDLLSTKRCSNVAPRVTALKVAIIQNQMAIKFSVISLVAATAILLALLSGPLQEPSHVLAQITPTLSPESSAIGVGFMTQEPANPVQNSTNANITQLATILPVANQPITPASFTPVSDVTEESDTTSIQNDDDDSGDSSSDNDNDSEDSDDSDDSADSNNDNGDDSDDSNNDNGNDSDDSNNDNSDNEDDGDEDDGDGDDDEGDGGGSFAFAGAGGAFAFAG